MEAQQYSQLELFSGVEGLPRAHPQSFLSRVWGYEKIILFTIGFIVATVIAFSLGVEKGRRLSDAKNTQRLDTAYKKAPVVIPSQGKTIKIQPQTVTPKTPLPIAPRQGTTLALRPSVTVQGAAFYTIQVASYKSRGLAQQEVEALKKKGLNPVLAPKGIYVVLCVGKFSTKETAKALLSELTKQYRDCFIRRI
jgi:hypothetical protein